MAMQIAAIIITSGDNPVLFFDGVDGVVGDVGVSGFVVGVSGSSGVSGLSGASGLVGASGWVLVITVVTTEKPLTLISVYEGLVKMMRSTAIFPEVPSEIPLIEIVPSVKLPDFLDEDFMERLLFDMFPVHDESGVKLWKIKPSKEKLAEISETSLVEVAESVQELAVFSSMELGHEMERLFEVAKEKLQKE